MQLGVDLFQHLADGKAQADTVVAAEFGAGNNCINR